MCYERLNGEAREFTKFKEPISFLAYKVSHPFTRLGSQIPDRNTRTFLTQNNKKPELPQEVSNESAGPFLFTAFR